MFRSFPKNCAWTHAPLFKVTTIKEVRPKAGVFISFLFSSASSCSSQQYTGGSATNVHPLHLSHCFVLDKIFKWTTWTRYMTSAVLFIAIVFRQKIISYAPRTTSASLNLPEPTDSRRSVIRSHSSSSLQNFLECSRYSLSEKKLLIMRFFASDKSYCFLFRKIQPDFEAT